MGGHNPPAETMYRRKTEQSGNSRRVRRERRRLTWCRQLATTKTSDCTYLGVEPIKECDHFSRKVGGDKCFERKGKAENRLRDNGSKTLSSSWTLITSMSKKFICSCRLLSDAIRSIRHIFRRPYYINNSLLKSHTMNRRYHRDIACCRFFFVEMTNIKNRLRCVA